MRRLVALELTMNALLGISSGITSRSKTSSCVTAARAVSSTLPAQLETDFK